MQSQRIRNSFRQKKGCVNREKKNAKRFVYGLAAAVKKPPSSFSWHELSTWTASGWARLWLAGHSLVAPIWSRGIFRQRGLNPPRFLFFLSTSPRSLHTHLCVCSFFIIPKHFLKILHSQTLLKAKRFGTSEPQSFTSSSSVHTHTIV